MPDDSSPPRLRPFWSGTITFGLVSVPVDLYPGYRSAGSSLRMVASDGTPLERRYYCPAHEREVGREEIVRGYEVEKDRYVVVRDEELEGLEPKKSREIDLQRFVDRDELDPAFFDRVYFLTPGGEATKPYRLLAETMERTGRAGIARFVMRGHEYLVAILADDGILRAETMRFHDEIRSAGEIGVPTLDGEEGPEGAAEAPSPTDERVARMRSAVRELSREGLEEEELRDRSEERLQAVVEKKLRSGDDVVTPKRAGEREEREEADSGDGDVIDLMEVLKQRLQRREEGDREKRGGGRAAAGKGGADGGGEAGASDESGLAELTKEELYERAQELDIPGRSTMNKAELVKAVASGKS